MKRLLHKIATVDFVRNFFALSLFLCIAIFSSKQSFALNRFSVATGNWNATSTWSATSGGASGASAPVAGDVVTIECGYTVTADIPYASSPMPELLCVDYKKTLLII